jgi:transcriptional regulator of acetoin/glycerol metabolism
VSRAALSARDGVVQPGDLQFLHLAAPAAAPVLPVLVPLRDVERDHIRRVLDSLKWNKKRASQVLQISRETLYRKIAEFALEPERKA